MRGSAIPRPVAAVVRPAAAVAPAVVVGERVEVADPGGGGRAVAPEGVAGEGHPLAGQGGAQLLVANITWGRENSHE